MNPLNAMPKYNLFGLDDQDYKKARVAVLPIPYDATLTYKTGSREGPRAIINASRTMELYSYELGRDLSKLGVYTMDELEPDYSSPENMVKRVKKEVGVLLDDKKIPLILGGEHTVTVGAVQALQEKGREFSVIQFDAHTDSRDELNNSKYMHATVMSRVMEACDSYLHVGIRNIDEAYSKKMKRERVLFMSDIHGKDVLDIIDRINDATLQNVYITIDLDVLDPSEMPSVGTPEPDGLRFGELAAMLKGIGEKKQLAGLDIVELSPIAGLHAPDFLAAKLAYLTLGYFLGKELD